MLTLSNQITVMVLLKGMNLFFFFYGGVVVSGDLYYVVFFCLFVFWYTNIKEGELLFLFFLSVKQLLFGR